MPCGLSAAGSGDGRDARRASGDDDVIMSQLPTILVAYASKHGSTREVADAVAFMSDGIIVEMGPPAQVLERPENPRTRNFLARFHRFMGSYTATG